MGRPAPAGRPAGPGRRRGGPPPLPDRRHRAGRTPRLVQAAVATLVGAALVVSRLGRSRGDVRVESMVAGGVVALSCCRWRSASSAGSGAVSTATASFAVRWSWTCASSTPPRPVRGAHRGPDRCSPGGSGSRTPPSRLGPDAEPVMVSVGERAGATSDDHRPDGGVTDGSLQLEAAPVASSFGRGDRDCSRTSEPGRWHSSRRSLSTANYSGPARRWSTLVRRSVEGCVATCTTGSDRRWPRSRWGSSQPATWSRRSRSGPRGTSGGSRTRPGPRSRKYAAWSTGCGRRYSTSSVGLGAPPAGGGA